MTLATGLGPVATLSKGQGFGEVALLKDEVRNATVSAKGECRCLALERATFLKQLERASAGGDEDEKRLRSMWDIADRDASGFDAAPHHAVQHPTELSPERAAGSSTRMRSGGYSSRWGRSTGALSSVISRTNFAMIDFSMNTSLTRSWHICAATRRCRRPSSRWTRTARRRWSSTSC